MGGKIDERKERERGGGEIVGQTEKKEVVV